jgi:hypothetical protein
MTFVAARDFRVTPPAAIALDAAGSAYAAGSFASTTPVNFQTASAGPPLELTSVGGLDAVIAKYDSSGGIQWAVDVGDDDGISANDQTATGVAATGAGQVAVIGKIVGSVTFGTSLVSGASATPYVAALSAASGARLWGKGFNLGSNGAFTAVASNPGSPSGRVAVCGQATAAASGLVSGTTFGGGSDLVVALFDATGTKLWAAQLGGTGNESCLAVAIDDAGDVFAAGVLDSSAVTFPGASPITLSGTGTTLKKLGWVAKFAGAGNGAGSARTLAAVSYGTTGNAVVRPTALAVLPGGDLVVGGAFSTTAIIGASMTSGGSDDAFVVRLAGAGATPTLAPVWNAIRFGGSGAETVRGVAATSSGDIVAVGTVPAASSAFKAANGGFDTSGVFQLAVSGTTAPDLYVAMISGATGAPITARTYGDANTQSGDAIAVNRLGPVNQVALAASVSGSATFGAAGAVTAVDVSDAALVFGTIP